MPHAIHIPGKISVLERLLAAFILFYGAMVFCLPVPFSEEVATLYPWWAKRIDFGNVLLQEAIFLVWILLYGGRFVLRAQLNGGIPTRQASHWLIALALWCGLMSLVAPLPWLDLGRTFRLLLNAALLFAVVRWTRQTGNFTLGMLILGFLVGTIINLAHSFQYPLIVGGIMRLSGQNTPGVAMGVAIHLSAWLFFQSRHRTMQVFTVLAAIVFILGCAISFSRIGWFAGGLGLVAWAYVMIAARPQERSERRRLKKLRLGLVPLLAVALLFLLILPLGQESLQWVQTLIQQKYSSAEDSNAARWAYVTGTAEILSRHPFGVGYSGFFDAMKATDTYRSGKAAEEESLVEANPHATFLWYTTAGGIPGGLLALGVFVMLLNSMRFGLVSAMGRPGLILFVLAAPIFLLIGLTVPYLFNSIILIVPAAIAAGWGWTWRMDWMTQMNSRLARTAALS
jgi:O-antigen ligase